MSRRYTKTHRHPCIGHTILSLFPTDSILYSLWLKLLTLSLWFPITFSRTSQVDLFWSMWSRHIYIYLHLLLISLLFAPLQLRTSFYYYWYQLSCWLSYFARHFYTLFQAKLLFEWTTTKYCLHYILTIIVYK